MSMPVTTDSHAAGAISPSAPATAATEPPFWRALLIGSILVPPSIYFGNYAYVVVQALIWGQTSLLRGPVCVLFALALLNLAFTRLFRRTGLQPSELIVIYSMVAIATCISGFGMLQHLINILPAGAYFGSSTNHYDRFLHFIPSFLAPHDKDVIRDFYLGRTNMYRPDILADWAMPVIAWSLFLIVLCWVTLCLTSLISRRWIDSERLAFPLVQLPLEMAQAASGQSHFFASKTMWAGFCLAGLLESVNCLNYFYPALPYIPIKPYHLEQFFKSPPLSSVGSFTIAFYPFAIGIAFLLSLEVSFSCWFFYLVTRLENVLCNAWGLTGGAGAHGAHANPPFLGEQGVGAFVGLGLSLLWQVRSAFVRGLSKTKNPDRDDVGLMSEGTATIGGLSGIAALTGFLVLCGLPLWAVLVFWAVYLLFVTVLTRIVAEAGAGWAWGPYVSLHGAIIEGSGTGAIGNPGLSAFGILSWFDIEYRDVPMPHQLEAIKMQRETAGSRHQMLWALLIAAALASIAGSWTYLHIYYEFGAASAKVRPALQGVGINSLKQVDDWLKNPRSPDMAGVDAMVVGVVIVAALIYLRHAFIWMPLHPIGYVLAGTQSMEYMWCPFFLGWLLKALVLRYGGVRYYRQALPFFLGLILGDYVVPMLWGIWGMANKTQVYLSFPH